MVSHISASIIRTAEPSWKRLYVFLPLVIESSAKYYISFFKPNLLYKHSNINIVQANRKFISVVISSK
jgi:hypothetical protein